MSGIFLSSSYSGFIETIPSEWATWSISNGYGEVLIQLPSNAIFDDSPTATLPNSWDFWNSTEISSINQNIPSTAIQDSEIYITISWDFWVEQQISSINQTLPSTAIQNI